MRPITEEIIGLKRRLCFFDVQVYSTTANLDESNCEYGVRSARGVVHVCRSCRPELVSLLHQPEDVPVLDDQMLGEVLHVGALCGMLPDFQVVGRVFLQQVLHVLVVNFQIGHLKMKIDHNTRLDLGHTLCSIQSSRM